jgi:ActR/RegA family two-component response regulator
MSTWFRDLFQPSLDEHVNGIEKNNKPQPIDNKLRDGLSDDETIFLIKLVDNGVKSFIFQIENLEENEVLKPIRDRLSNIQIFSAIKSLEKKNVLLREDQETSLLCPNCYSQDIRVKFSCSKCESDHITKSEIFEHPYCGYRGIRSTFTLEGSLICPKCNSNLTKKENLDKNLEDTKSSKVVYVTSYRVNGSVFECSDCKTRMNKPDIDFHCKKCRTKFNYTTAIYQTPIKYTISDSIFNKIQSRNKVNLLIVEDYVPQAEVLSMLISSSTNLNIDISIAHNGADALNLIKKKEYNLIILDLGLPDINGLQLLKEIKEANPESKVIVYTGYDDREIAVEAMKIGASEFLIKNNNEIETLPGIVEKIITNNNMID